MRVGLVAAGTGGAVVASAAVVFAVAVVPDDDPRPDPTSPSACVPSAPPVGEAAPVGDTSVERSVTPGGVAVSGAVGVSVQRPVVDGEGRDWQSATVTLADVKLTNEWQRRFQDNGMSGSIKAGAKLTTTVTAPTATMGALDWSVPPNPLDPSSIPVDSSVTLDRAAYAGARLDGRVPEAVSPGVRGDRRGRAVGVGDPYVGGRGQGAGRAVHVGPADDLTGVRHRGLQCLRGRQRHSHEDAPGAGRARPEHRGRLDGVLPDRVRGRPSR